MGRADGRKTHQRTLYLVRHAHAGKRHSWDGPDAERPLSKKGRRQAAALVPVLDDQVKRILSSPAVRCVQTVQPLARHVGLEVTTTEALAEGAPLGPAMDLVCSLLDGGAVLCAHGDLVPDMLGWFAAHGADVDGSQATAKGAAWALDISDGKVSAARYLPPPSSD